jgi:hypothetical protein
MYTSSISSKFQGLEHPKTYVIAKMPSWPEIDFATLPFWNDIQSLLIHFSHTLYFNNFSFYTFSQPFMKGHVHQLNNWFPIPWENTSDTMGKYPKPIGLKPLFPFFTFFT